VVIPFKLMGNRDINKLRFAAELDPTEIERSGLHAWTTPHASKPFADWLDKKHREAVRPDSKAACTSTVGAGAAGVELGGARLGGGVGLGGAAGSGHLGVCGGGATAKVGANTQVDRLKWMLEETLSCPTTFELRRTSLANERAIEPTAVPDPDVVADFVESVGFGGVVLEYLQHADLMVCIGNTVFVHGALGRWHTPSVSIRFSPTLRHGLNANVTKWLALPTLRHGLNANVTTWLALPTLRHGLNANVAGPSAAIQRPGSVMTHEFPYAKQGHTPDTAANFVWSLPAGRRSIQEWAGGTHSSTRFRLGNHSLQDFALATIVCRISPWQP
jgi:hypothetical protein